MILMRIITRKTEGDRIDNIQTKNHNYPDDYRFSKDTYIRDADPVMNRLNERMGTPSHIEYLKMSEDDNRRHKARCADYDHKTGKCMCTKSPNFIMKCAGSSRCDYYSENIENINSAYTVKSENTGSKVQEKKIVKVIPKAIYKKRKCPMDGLEMVGDVINVTYSKNGEIIHNKLTTYRCEKCNENYISDTLYKSYTASKNIAELSVEFRKFIDNLRGMD